MVMSELVEESAGKVLGQDHLLIEKNTRRR